MHQIHTHICACTYTCHSYRHTFTYTCTQHGPASAHTHTNYFIHKPTHCTQLSAQVPREGHFFVRTVRAMLQVPAVLHRSPLKRSAQVTALPKVWETVAQVVLGMWALRVVASLWVGAARLPLLYLPPVSSSSLPSSCTPSTSLSPSSLAVKLLDQYLRWACAQHQLMHAHRAVGQRFPLSRESRACVCSPVWATCAPGSRSYMSRQAGVARPPHCKPLSRGGGETLPGTHAALNTA